MSDETVDSDSSDKDKVLDFKKYQNKKSKKEAKAKNSYLQTQNEVDDLISRSKPLSKKDKLQLELVGALAEHVHYLSLLVEKLIEDKKVLEEKLEKLNSKV